MNESDVAAIVRRLRILGGDDAECEVKECAQSLSNDIWESVSAFANTRGGTIILGLSERNGFAPVPDFAADRVCAQFVCGMGDGGQESRLVNAPRYSISRVPFEGSVVLAILVEELDAARKPCYIMARGERDGSYKRVDDGDILLTENEVFALRNASIPSAADREPVPDATLADLDRAICDAAIARAAQATPRALRGTATFEERLKRLNILDPRGAVTKAGLIVAGVYPQQFFPKLCIDVAVHAGTRKASSGGPRFKSRVICEGAAGDMINDAVAAIAANLRRVPQGAGAARLDGRAPDLEIPEEILREAVANAVAHREYDARFIGESVAVDIFDDRIEVVNPGGLWGKSRSDMADGRSACRNVVLMRLLSLVPVPGISGLAAEGNGTGILYMRAECAKRALRSPEFVPSIDHFTVVLRRPDA